MAPRYSAMVVAPMQLRFPRASAGFMIWAASMLPSALPAARVRDRVLCHRGLLIPPTANCELVTRAQRVGLGVVPVSSRVT